MLIEMKRLRFVVVCQSTRPFFETIAAFDCRPAAEAYAGECAKAKAYGPIRFEYRVVDREDRTNREI